MRGAIFIFFFVMPASLFSQAFRLHLGSGFANYVGDIQQKRLSFNQVKFMYSLGAAYDINDKVAIRFDYSHAQVGADDKKGKSSRTIKRNLNFQTIIKEISVLGEYTWENDYTKQYIPYVFGGVGIFKFNPYTFDTRGQKVILFDLSTEGEGLKAYPNRKPYKRTQFNIPIGFGFKTFLNPGIFVAAEFGFRKLFTDYIDDVSTTYVDANALRRERGQLAVDLAYRGNELAAYNLPYPAAGSQRGSKANDLYYFGQLRISFRLKWNNGFGGRGGGGGYSRKGSLRRLGCPGGF